MLEAPQPGLDLGVVNEQVADLGREFRDLIRDVMQGECAHRDKHSSELKHCFDLRHLRVVDLKRMHRSQCRLGEQRACDRAASITSVFARRRLRRAFAERYGGTSRGSNPPATIAIAMCAPRDADRSTPNMPTRCAVSQHVDRVRVARSTVVETGVARSTALL